MITRQQVVDSEINFPRGFADVAERPYGLLFYNSDNPQSHDSNHAIILRLDLDLPSAVDDIVAFYREKNLTPHIYPAHVSGEQEALHQLLQSKGFTVHSWSNRFFILRNPSRIAPRPEVEVRRVHCTDEGMRQAIVASDGGEWTVRVLERHLRLPRFHLLVGYVDSQPVSMASVNLLDGLSLVDDVLTYAGHRNKGYSRAVIDHLVRYHQSISSNELFLWTNCPIAARIYEQAGFSEVDLELSCWSAWME